MTEDPVALAAEKMRVAGQSADAIVNFRSALSRVQSGDAKMISSVELEPVSDVPMLDDLPPATAGALDTVVVIKLNGGLATSMGLQEPKSLLQAREGHSFLEIIAGQVLAARRRYDAKLPLILMDSDATRAPTLMALQAFPALTVDGLELDFLQSMVPKLDAQTYAPVSWPAAPALEWNPPGHGDVYAALRGSGTLSKLIKAGYRYAMISNADNLGATPDPRIAAYVAERKIPFLMEAVIGTAADRKGGHIARRLEDGQLILRETAQTPPEDIDSFTDFERWRYYNTNSLWVNLEALENQLASSAGLQLPVIVNSKTVDPRDRKSTPVIQLESAMGAAIGCFPGAAVLAVPRTRFAPVKTTDDLAVLRSDLYAIDADWNVKPVAETWDGPPYVAFDKQFYAMIDSFEARVPDPLSLRDAQRLVVHGDVRFGKGVSVHGDVTLQGGAEPMTIVDDAVLEQEPARNRVS